MSYVKFDQGLAMEWFFGSSLGWLETQVAKPVFRIAGYWSNFLSDACSLSLYWFFRFCEHGNACVSDGVLTRESASWFFHAQSMYCTA
jgi:hypothetical protein